MNRQFLSNVHYLPRVGYVRRELFNFLYNLTKLNLLVSVIVFPIFVTGKRGIYIAGLVIALITAIIISLYNLYLAKSKGTMLTIDGHQMGVWAYSPRHHRLLYIPFRQIDVLRIHNQHLVLQYQQSFILNDQQTPRIAGMGQIKYPLWIFSAKEADEFVKLYNQLVPKGYQTDINLYQLKKLDHYEMPKMALFVGMLLIVGTGSMPRTASIMSVLSGSNVKRETKHIHQRDFAVNKTYESGSYRFKFLKAYRATTTYNNPVGIVQVELTAKRSQGFNDLPAIDFDSFKSASSIKTFTSDTENPRDMVDYVVLKDGRGVVNQLHNEDNLRQAQRVVFNLVFEIPDKKKTCYLAYEPFSFDSGPSEYDDTTAIIWKIKPSELEEVK